METGTEFFEDVVAGVWIGTTSLGLTASSLVVCFFPGLESSCPAAVLRLSLDFRFFGAIFGVAKKIAVEKQA